MGKKVIVLVIVILLLLTVFNLPVFALHCDVADPRGILDERDIQEIASHFGQRNSYDFNGDGTVNIQDINICVAEVERETVLTGLGLIPTRPGRFVTTILQIAVGVAGGIAFLLMVVGSVRILVSGGDPEALAAGRDMLTSAVAGLLFIILSVVILRIIGIDILKIPIFQ